MSVTGQREYLLREQITLVNDGPGQPEKQNIWVALIRDFPPYQAVRSIDISPAAYTPVTDEYGNSYAEFDLSDHPAGTTRVIEIQYRVAVKAIAYDLSACEGALPDEWTQPEQRIESANPQITTLAEQLSQGAVSACQKARAFYDYIGDTVSYNPNGKNWGAQAALGPMGADCTEYAALFAAFNRAQGIPARYFEGLLFRKSQSGAAAAEHAWNDVYLPETGWTAVDATLGQPKVDREVYFARYTPDHIIVTLGAAPSVLRGSSYWTHLYWPGNSTEIRVSGSWHIERLDEAKSD